MDLNDYFDPVELERPSNYFPGNKNMFYRNIQINTPNEPVGNITDSDIALFGVPEDRNGMNKGTSQAVDPVRNKLFQLTKIPGKIKIIDLGNLKTGHKVIEINYFYFTGYFCDVVSWLCENKILPVMIGGSHDLTYGTFLAHALEDHPISMVTVDSRLDLQIFEEELGSFSYLNKIFEQKSKLFNYTNLGHQSYFVTFDELNLLERLNFSSLRLGMLKSNISEAEPVLRDATMVSMDISSVRYSDAPGFFNPSPHGLYGEDLCQLAWYAGLGLNLQSFGIYEVNPLYDQSDVTASLAAQVLWYFLDGVSAKKVEIPISDNNFKRFIVNLSGDGFKENIIFHKSSITERWWMEVPFGTISGSSPLFIACSEDDYKKACLNEIPDRLFHILKKNK